MARSRARPLRRHPPGSDSAPMRRHQDFIRHRRLKTTSSGHTPTGRPLLAGERRSRDTLTTITHRCHGGRTGQGFTSRRGLGGDRSRVTARARMLGARRCQALANRRQLGGRPSRGSVSQRQLGDRLCRASANLVGHSAHMGRGRPRKLSLRHRHGTGRRPLRTLLQHRLRRRRASQERALASSGS